MTMKVIYTAIFVKDIPSLLKSFEPKHKNIFAHHSTIAFRPPDLSGIELGKECKIKIVGRVSDDKGDVLLVENNKSENKYPHITLSCVDGVAPKYSQELLEKTVVSNSVELFPEPIFVEGIEGYFDGVSDVIK